MPTKMKTDNDDADSLRKTDVHDDKDDGKDCKRC